MTPRTLCLVLCWWFLCGLAAGMLSGCALLPDGSEGGAWIRIGPDPNNSAATSWRVGGQDPSWRCPPGSERGLGVPDAVTCGE